MKTHRFDAVSFIAGLTFSIIGLVFLIPETPQEIIDLLLNSGAWFWPVALMVVGTRGDRPRSHAQEGRGGNRSRSSPTKRRSGCESPDRGSGLQGP